MCTTTESVVVCLSLQIMGVLVLKLVPIPCYINRVLSTKITGQLRFTSNAKKHKVNFVVKTLLMERGTPMKIKNDFWLVAGMGASF